MIDKLPPEIIYQVAANLELGSFVSLAKACRRLYNVILNDQSLALRTFLRDTFPSVETPPYWRGASMALVARSRALERHAVTARLVLPPRDTTKIGCQSPSRRDSPTIGYCPVIDSYEYWNGERWLDRTEVLAWGAGDELVMRIKELGSRSHEKWLIFNDLEHTSTYDDICGVHLLKPDNFGWDADEKHLILGRLRGDAIHLAISPDKKTYEHKHNFTTFGQRLSHLDVSGGREPLLAAHLDGDIALYRAIAESEEVNVHPFAAFRSVSGTRCKYSKFLSNRRLALGTGDPAASLSIVNISPEGVHHFWEIGARDLGIENQTFTSRNAKVNAIAPINAQWGGASSSDVFLAGWGDGIVRYEMATTHDLSLPVKMNVSN